MRKTIGETTTLNGKTLSSFLSFTSGTYKDESWEFRYMNVISFPVGEKYERVVIGEVANKSQSYKPSDKNIKIQVKRTGEIDESDFIEMHFAEVNKIKRRYLIS
jgi:hypothetical protein